MRSRQPDTSICTITQQDGVSKKQKEQRSKLGLQMKGLCYWPSLPPTRVKLEAMGLFWKLESQVGLLEVMSCFQKAIDLGNVSG